MQRGRQEPPSLSNFIHFYAAFQKKKHPKNWPNKMLTLPPLGLTLPVWDMLAPPLGPISCEISLTQLYLATRMTTDRVRLMSHYSNIAVFKGICIDFVEIISSKDNHQLH